MKKPSSGDARRVCYPGKKSDNIKIDPEFENLIPPLSPRELADLHKSIDAEKGCRDAVIVWRGHDILVDGHNRIRYCREKGYPFPVVEKEFDNRAAVKAYIVSEHVGRRNLSPAAESYLRGNQYLDAKRQGARTDLTSGQSDQKSDQKTAAERLGKEFKVGEKTIRRDGKFAEALDRIIENCGPEAKNLILARDTGLTRGGVHRLAKLNPKEQQKYLEELKENGKRPRKIRKGKQRARLTLPAQPKALVRALVRQFTPEEIAEVSKALVAAMEKQGESKSKEQAGERTPSRKRKNAKC